MKSSHWVCLGVSCMVLAGCHSGDSSTAESAAAIVDEGDVALVLPTDYKSYGTYMISDRLGQEDQVIALYANPTAREGARADGTLPYGSVIVGELYKAKLDDAGDVILSDVGRRVPNELTAIVIDGAARGLGRQISR